MKIIVALILFVSSLNLFSNNLADSLTTVWKTKTLPDTVRFAAVKQLVWKVYLHTQVDSAIKYSQEQYDFALKIKDKTNMAAAKNSLGVAYRTKGEYIKAIESLEQCILIYEELKDDQGVAGALGNLGILYMSQAEYGKALKNFLHCYKVFENAGNIGGMLNAINYIGGVYIFQNFGSLFSISKQKQHLIWL